ncbi:serine/threonine-protein kinase rio2-like [Hibiscus syriacus]|uniref:serine/threonine-protein kinase rio2-like n=1 Tax=Hibiscus syriacus TaxID=106335 RepID=UPI001924CAAB|nr:serine/threonine-protein kinase rio2-like [Hibiscus syriacus]
MKLHRLGRTSFRAVKSKRDYLRHRSSYNWLYLSRLAALKEFAFMNALEEHGFPVPNAVDSNRHCVAMSLTQGYPLVQVKELQNPETVFETIIGLVVRLAEHGLIHCDFNEFNIMIDDDEKVTMIDFPQMVSVSHRNAQMYFDRDIECIYKFFVKRFNLSFEECSDDIHNSDVDPDESSRPSFSSTAKTAGYLDKELAASGFTRKDEDEIQKTNSSCNEEDQVDENLQSTEAGQRGDPEGQNSSNEEEDDEQKGDEDDTELVKSLAKQRRRAMAAARKGHKNTASRNSYKDKGCKVLVTKAADKGKITAKEHQCYQTNVSRRIAYPEISHSHLEKSLIIHEQFEDKFKRLKETIGAMKNVNASHKELEARKLRLVHDLVIL